jgi:hypothetical protein
MSVRYFLEKFYRNKKPHLQVTVNAGVGKKFCSLPLKLGRNNEREEVFLMPAKKATAICGGFASVLFLSGCSALPDMSPEPGTYVNFSAGRRLYVNDSAANDSLSAGFARNGVYFVMQPGKNYSVRFADTTLLAGDRLDFYSITGGSSSKVGTLDPAASQNGVKVFNLPASARSSWSYFFAKLQPIDSIAGAAKRIKRVRLLPSASQAEAHTLKVHLFLVGTFQRVSETGKAAFASALLGKLKSLLQRYDITVDTSSEVVQPELGRVSVAFSSTFTNLPGNRVANAVNIYMVDSISAANLSPGKFVLGFSPREVVDLSQDPTSRVVLAARADSMTLASTAAHEMGHFFGLRHPSATSADLQTDNDQGNRDDGLHSTGFCQDMALTKMAAFYRTEAETSDGKGYCLRISASNCPSSCSGDLRNLMFAYACSGVVQDSLTSEQQAIERQNMALLQGK